MNKVYRLMSSEEFTKFQNGEVVTSSMNKVFFVPENLQFSVDGTELSGPISENTWFFDEFFCRDLGFIVEFVAADTVSFNQEVGAYNNVDYFFPGDFDFSHKEVVVQELSLASYSKRELSATAVVYTTGYQNLSTKAFVKRVWEPKAL